MPPRISGLEPPLSPTELLQEVFTGRMPFLSLSQQSQSTKEKIWISKNVSEQ